VTYQVNGQPNTPITSTSRTLNFATGLSVVAYKTGSASVNVTTSSTSLAQALAGFTAAYNNAFDELSKSRGQSGGALTGDSIIYSLTQSLRNLTASGGASGSVQSISDLGLTYDKTGHLNFDAGVLSATMTAAPSALASFLGSSTSGFLQGAKSIVNAVTDSTSGLIPQTENTNSAQLTTIANKVSSLQERINVMQSNLELKMSKADALISSLQNQTSYYTNLFAQMRANQQSGL
jgi:flagellar hook-associated protein 2